MQASLHQRVALALADQRNGLGGSSVAVRDVDELELRYVQIAASGDLANPFGRPDQDWCDDSRPRGFDSTLEGCLLAGVHHDGRQGCQRSGALYEPLVFLVCASVSLAFDG